MAIKEDTLCKEFKGNRALLSRKLRLDSYFNLPLVSSHISYKLGNGDSINTSENKVTQFKDAHLLTFWKSLNC
jgi:hypothetical protein